MARMKDLAFEKASRGPARRALDSAAAAMPLGAAVATLAMTLGLALWVAGHGVSGVQGGSELSALDATAELMAAGGA